MKIIKENITKKIYNYKEGPAIFADNEKKNLDLETANQINLIKKIFNISQIDEENIFWFDPKAEWEIFEEMDVKEENINTRIKNFLTKNEIKIKNQEETLARKKIKKYNKEKTLIRKEFAKDGRFSMTILTREMKIKTIII